MIIVCTICVYSVIRVVHCNMYDTILSDRLACIRLENKNEMGGGYVFCLLERIKFDGFVSYTKDCLIIVGFTENK